MIIVRARRGSVEMKARIGCMRQGEVFIPFHFGYWDAAKGGRATAANELTMGECLKSARTDWKADIPCKAMGSGIQEASLRIRRSAH